MKTLETLPPHDLDAETQVLGCILLDAHYQGIAVVGAIERLEALDFYDGRLRLLWTAVVETWTKDGKLPSPIAVRETLRRWGRWNAETKTLVENVARSVVGVGNLLVYVDRVRALSRARKLRAALVQALEALEEGSPVPDILARLLSDLVPAARGIPA